MKRTLGALLLVVGLAALPLHVADAAPADQVKGPGCGDIFTSTDYVTAGGNIPATAFSSVTTAKPSCIGVTYRLVVLDAAGNSLLPASVTTDEFVGDGVTSELPQLSGEPTGGPSTVCISIESRTSNGKVIDQAPDTPDLGCARGAVFELDGATGGRPMG